MAECIKNQQVKKDFFAPDKKHAKKIKDLMKIIELEFTKLSNKVACLRPVTLFLKKLQHRCFSVNFVTF